MIIAVFTETPHKSEDIHIEGGPEKDEWRHTLWTTSRATGKAIAAGEFGSVPWRLFCIEVRLLP